LDICQRTMARASGTIQMKRRATYFRPTTLLVP
jgi:hypothetical protein